MPASQSAYYLSCQDDSATAAFFSEAILGTQLGLGLDLHQGPRTPQRTPSKTRCVYRLPIRPPLSFSSLLLSPPIMKPLVPSHSSLTGSVSTMARFRTHQHKKNARSIASEDPWKVDTPFGPPQISHIHVPGGIRRIRNTFAKLTPSARAERHLLRQKNLYKSPLTERNVDTFVTHQEFTEACYPNRHSNEVQVAAWLDRLY